MKKWYRAEVEVLKKQQREQQRETACAGDEGARVTEAGRRAAQESACAGGEGMVDEEAAACASRRRLESWKTQLRELEEQQQVLEVKERGGVAVKGAAGKDTQAKREAAA